MTTNIKFTNFASTTLASGISAGATSIPLAAATGALFPSLSGGQYFYGVLIDAATGSIKEVVKATARSTDTITATRAQDGTSASAFIAGDKFELRLVAAAENLNIRSDEVILTANKTLSVTNSLTLSGTDSTTMTFPTTNATIARTDAAQSFTGVQTFVAPILGTPTSGTLTNCTGLPIAGLAASTSTALGVGSIELGAASDTTIARVSAGVASVEGATIGTLSTAQTWTKPQRGTVTTSNTITAIDLSTTNNHISTPAAGAALTFTNLTPGQTGTIEFVNGSNYAITAGSGTKVTSTFLATISVTGTYIISYFVNAAGTSVHCSTGGASA
jgi:hypothetical protein